MAVLQFFLVNSTLNIYSIIYYIYSSYNTDILILYNYNFRDSSESESETQSAPVLEDLINIESNSRSNRRAGLRESERLVARFIFPSSANKTPKTVLRIPIRICWISKILLTNSVNLKEITWIHFFSMRIQDKIKWIISTANNTPNFLGQGEMIFQEKF